MISYGFAELHTKDDPAMSLFRTLHTKHYIFNNLNCYQETAAKYKFVRK